MYSLGSFDEHLKYEFITRKGFFQDIRQELNYIPKPSAKNIFEN